MAFNDAADDTKFDFDESEPWLLLEGSAPPVSKSPVSFCGDPRIAGGTKSSTSSVLEGGMDNDDDDSSREDSEVSTSSVVVVVVVVVVDEYDEYEDV